MSKIVTLDEFIIRSQKEITHATGELSRLLRDIGIAAKIINVEVNKAGLGEILGAAEKENQTGDNVQKLDIFSNEKMIEFLANSGECCGVASEELDEFVSLPKVLDKDANYIVVTDPLDGSSNIDVNVSVGTIFGIYKRVSSPDSECTLADFLQFTLDPAIGEFCLSHPNIKMPERGNYYSVNQGYYLKFDLEMRRYIDHCSDLNLRLRYIGSRKYPQGKLRLLYEANPISMIVEQAGGTAINTKLERILDLDVQKIHQRTTVVMGSKAMVQEMKEFVQRYSAIEI